MTCAEVQASLSLYLYGELDFAAEEAFEHHVCECSFCQLTLNREKEWHAAVNRQDQDISPEWLAACRRDLYAQIAAECPSRWHLLRNAGDRVRGFFDFRTTERSYRLAVASFLIIVGFGAGRMMRSVPLPGSSIGFGNAASVIQPAVTQVREIQPEAGNRVRIVLQQVRVREVLGSRDDDGVRNLLVSAVRESDDPGVRMDSVEMLAGQSGLEIRNAIVAAIKNDPNAAVRVRAVELLRRFPGDAVTRDALEFALAHDHDPGVRSEAMDVLVPAGARLQVTPQLLQTITDVMRSAPDDEYLHSRCAQILSLQASQNGVY